MAIAVWAAQGYTPGMEDRSNEQFVEVDFTGSRFHGVVFSGVRISDAWLADVDVSGMVSGLSVNGLDVTEYVEAELDRRHPERRLLAPDDPPGARLAWQAVEELSSATLERARALPPAALDDAVGGEWSYLETLRHLVFATDRWISGPVLGDPDPFHRLGRPNDPLDEIPAGAFDRQRPRPSPRQTLDRAAGAGPRPMRRNAEEPPPEQGLLQLRVVVGTGCSGRSQFPRRFNAVSFVSRHRPKRDK